jgi:hypothetical protein
VWDRAKIDCVHLFFFCMRFAWLESEAESARAGKRRHGHKEEWGATEKWRAECGQKDLSLSDWSSRTGLFTRLEISARHSVCNREGARKVQNSKARKQVGGRGGRKESCQVVEEASAGFVAQA